MTVATLFAVCDPNWGEGPVPLLTTLSDTVEGAIDKALSTEERGASMYSGASNICTPPIKGNWARMVGFGYHVRTVSIVLGGPA